MEEKQPKNSLGNQAPTDVANTPYERIPRLCDARASIVRSVDTTMVKAYWHIGQHIG